MATLPLTETVLAPAPVRVERRRRETADTWTLELDGGLPEIQPGQFAMVYAFGVGEVPISVSGDAARDDRTTLTVRAVGPVTRAICAARPGTVLGVRGPFGRGWPMEAAVGNDVVLVAGGLGLAPLRPALYHLLAHREGYGEIAVLYGARTPADLLYRRELERWRARFDLTLDVTVDSALQDWRGKVGVVPGLVARAPFDSEATVAMVCGPEVMMRFTAVALLDRGVPADRIFVSLERNMQCGVALCGHCQLGPVLVCRDGPVLPHDRIGPYLTVREL